MVGNSNPDQNDRVFLMLQGPHGPFFSQLGRMLRAANATVWRIGFNAGDQFFWRGKSSYIPFREPIENWADFFQAQITEKSVTDIVLYGDVREIHATAIKIARAKGITIHVFEEGYIRPYWATYERDGSNGHSRLMDLSIPDMQKALKRSDIDSTPPPATWGDMRQHIYYGALYHSFLLLFNQRYKNFKPHRELNVGQEFLLHIKRLIMTPAYALERNLATWKVRNSGFPYHLALLQLEHDSSFRTHSPFDSMSDFIELVIEGFKKGAPGHHHLVFKAHPLEDGRIPMRRKIMRIAIEHGVKDRIHFIRGGKLAQLLNEARTAVTVNSTAAQQVLWRGIPLRTFGDTVYNKPEFVSTQPLSQFFTEPHRPDRTAYVDYRRFLMETSQLSGGFYSSKGRRQILRRVVDKMLDSRDPYDQFIQSSAAPTQHLSVIN